MYSVLIYILYIINTALILEPARILTLISITIYYNPVKSHVYLILRELNHIYGVEILFF